jgi:hypothetical protein
MTFITSTISHTLSSFDHESYPQTDTLDTFSDSDGHTFSKETRIRRNLGYLFNVFIAKDLNVVLDLRSVV